MEYRGDDFAGHTAAVPMFAWLPVRLDTGRMAWLRRVYWITNRYDQWYSLTVPRNAL